MSAATAIGWTDATWNPVTGCDRISPGCDNCYALDLAARLKAMGNPRYQRDGEPPRSGPGFGVTLHLDKANQPQRWRSPRMIFVNSMSDLFHEEIPEEYIDRLWAVMTATDRHRYQILTKRPARVREFLRFAARRVPDHVWIGVSVETQQWARVRVPQLLKVDTAVRFLSIEPMLAPVDISPWIEELQWVIVGGESGPKRRQFNPFWARDVRDTCVAAGVPFFYKQGSDLAPGKDRELDGRTWDEMPV